MDIGRARPHSSGHRLQRPRKSLPKGELSEHQSYRCQKLEVHRKTRLLVASRYKSWLHYGQTRSSSRFARAMISDILSRCTGRSPRVDEIAMSDTSGRA